LRFVAEQRHVYGVKRLCGVLGVSRSGFYAWLGSVALILARRVELQPLSGTRWMEEEPVPNVPLLAWMEINGGIE
jgi:hypothetical protein